MTRVEPSPFVACPLCHTSDSVLTLDTLGDGRLWQCPTCGQRWTAGRLATVVAYAAWAAEWDRPAGQA